MVKILGISGRKQSGKNTAANLINGLILTSKGLARDFFIDKGGNLVISTVGLDGKEGYGVFDITRKDASFVEYAERELWPYVKLYSFADGLKNLCIEFFGLSIEQVYGTDDEKNTLTPLMWEDTPTWKKTQPLSNEKPPVKGPMTAREVMQYFGTNIMRKMYEPVHVRHAIGRILAEQSELAIMPDVRFPNEVEAIKQAGGVVIRLERSTLKDTHASETSLDRENFDWGNFDFIIDNSSNNTEEFCSQIQSMFNKLELKC